MNDSGSASAALGIFSLLYCLFIVAIIAFQIFLFWRIFAKTGQSGAMSLIGLIPGIGLFVLLCILAFGTWPIEQQRMMPPEMMPGSMPPPPTGYGQPYPQTQYPPYPPQ